MSKIFDVEEKIGKIAAKFPKSMEIFKEYNIDFCCGGDRILRDVLKEQKLDEEEVMTKIERNITEL